MTVHIWLAPDDEGGWGAWLDSGDILKAEKRDGMWGVGVRGVGTSPSLGAQGQWHGVAISGDGAPFGHVEFGVPGVHPCKVVL